LSELAKQMQAHGIKEPENLTEFDQWVNDATRADIQKLVKEHNAQVFGLSVWTWKKTRGIALNEANNFSVDYIFKNSDEPAVDKITTEHDETAKGKEWDKEMQKLAWKTVENLYKLALDSCLWV